MSASKMEARKPKDLPFYETPDHIQTSAKIVSEAKTQLLRSQLKPIGTKRPVTPQEGGRKLFGEQSSRDPSNRPPSAFRSARVVKTNFVWLTSEEVVLRHLY